MSLSKTLDGRIDGVFTLLAPLSHIGESHGPDSYLDTTEILGPDGRPVEVFCYHGNALRGMLRDMAGVYMLDRLGVQVPLDVFYLLFSGGSIGGEQAVDIDQARRIRQAVPAISVLGGGVGNQILPGKIQVGDAWPLCAEVQHLLPENLRRPGAVSWRQMTTERSFSRKDDAKDENLRVHLYNAPRPEIGPGGQIGLLPPAGAEKENDGKGGRKEQPQQMRYTIECLAPGARLWTRIHVQRLTDLEMGALASAFAQWTRAPYLGGQNRIGFGLCAAAFTWTPFGGEPEEFAVIGEGGMHRLGPTAERTKAAYDAWLEEYVRYLDERREGLVKLLDARAR